ncbi:MAG: hypothetical protein AAGM84_16505 [Pseudomonadota bacterium]
MRMAALALPLAACVAEPEITAERLIPDYRGVETRLLDDELVQFRVEMTNALSGADVEDYARCAAAGYTLIRGYGFARHVRTSTDNEGALWTGDAVYLISPDLPRGLRTIDAEVVAANCAEQGIPLV